MSAQNPGPLNLELSTAEALWDALDSNQQQKATVAVGTDGMDTKQGKLDPIAVAGLRAAEMTAAQVKLLRTLVDLYLDNMNKPIAAWRRAAIEANGFDDVSYARSGRNFRVLGPSFIIEAHYPNNSDNHVHTVWRDYTNDYGADLIAEHMAHDH